MNNNYKVMTPEILRIGRDLAKNVKPKEGSAELLLSPLESISTPDGWGTVVSDLILEKQFNFKEASEKLNELWEPALEQINKNTAKTNGKPKKQLFSGPALSRRVLELAREKFKKANSDLRCDIAESEKEEARKVLDELNALAKRFGWHLGNPEAIAADNAKNPKAAVKPQATNEKAKKAQAKTQDPEVGAQAVTSNLEKPRQTDPATEATTDPLKPEAQSLPGAQSASRETSTSPADPAGKSPAVADQIPKNDGQFTEGQKVSKELFPCPKCGGQMKVRKATKGPYKDKLFLGCLAFWKGCHGSRDTSGQDTTR